MKRLNNITMIKTLLRCHHMFQWSVGDFIISDNLSVAHEAAPETQLPRSEVGLRVLHRVTTKGHSPPTKLYNYKKELGLQ